MSERKVACSEKCTGGRGAEVELVDDEVTFELSDPCA
jgi:hypothetical protein